MTRSELEYSDSSMIGPAMLFLNQYFNTYFKEYYVLWVCLVSLPRINGDCVVKRNWTRSAANDWVLISRWSVLRRSCLLL